MSDPILCEGPDCPVVFDPVGDDWYQLSRMHDDRVGAGPLKFHSKLCAIKWLRKQINKGNSKIILGKEPQRCKHGHEGWMEQRLIKDKLVSGEVTFYWTWMCRECARLATYRKDQRRRQKKAA